MVGVLVGVLVGVGAFKSVWEEESEVEEKDVP